MKLEEIILNPGKTLVLAVDVEKDFLESQPGFVFHDAGADVSEMQRIVREGIVPLLRKSSDAGASVGLVKAQYHQNQFPKPFENLCTKAPGTDFYMIDGIVPNAAVFTKNAHNPLSNPRLREYMEEIEIQDLVMSGFTVTHCIDAGVDSAILIPQIRIIIPEDCVGYRKERAESARKILDGYASPSAKRILVVGSQKGIVYKKN